MINWSKYFDKIICIHYSEMKLRKQLLQFELKRVGILDSGIFQYQITFQNNYLFKLSELAKIHYTLAYLSDTKGHIDAVRKAYHEGCNRVLIIEDNIRFLKDLNKIKQILQNIPDEKQWEIILLSSHPQCTAIFFNNIVSDKRNILNKYFCKPNKDLTLLSSVCYCLNRRGMKLLFENYNINHFEIIDWLWNKKYIFKQRLFSTRAIAIQTIFQSDFKKATLNLQQYYKLQNINLNDYMMRKDGSSFNYGDYIEE